MVYDNTIYVDWPSDRSWMDLPRMCEPLCNEVQSEQQQARMHASYVSESLYLFHSQVPAR